jgi:hypothetical protein
MKFEDKERLENHKKVHDRKSKVYGYGDPKFDYSSYSSFVGR